MILVGRLFGGDWLGVALGGVESGVPAEGRALDTGGELVDAGERGEVRHIVLRDRPGGDELVDAGVDDLGQVAEDDMSDLAALAGVHQFPARIKCATLGWHAALNAAKGDATTATTEKPSD